MARMNVPALQLTIAPTGALEPSVKAAIVDVCTRAFAEDFSSLFDLVEDAQHVLANQEGRLVGHACWTTRWLQPEGCPPLRTAYVDAVAVDPACQGRGLGSAMLR